MGFFHDAWDLTKKMQETKIKLPVLGNVSMLEIGLTAVSFPIGGPALLSTRMLVTQAATMAAPMAVDYFDKQHAAEAPQQQHNGFGGAQRAWSEARAAVADYIEQNGTAVGQDVSAEQSGQLNTQSTNTAVQIVDDGRSGVPH